MDGRAGGGAVGGSSQPIAELVDRSAFCDPAGGRVQLRKVRARSAIIVVAQDAMSRVFVLHAWADRCSTDRLYERIFAVNEQFTPRVFGVEANAMQSLFADGIRREGRLSNRMIPLVPVLQPTRLEKTFRNRSALQPVIAAGRLFLQDHQIELVNELTTHPMSSTFDLVDALASAISLLPQRTVRQREDTEQVALARYLRQTGAPAWYIEKRLAQLAALKVERAFHREPGREPR